MHGAGAGDGTDGLVLVSEIGGDRLRRSGSRPRIAADKPGRLIPGGGEFDEVVCNPSPRPPGGRRRLAADKPERLIPGGEKFDEFVANRSPCSEDGSYLDPAFRACWFQFNGIMRISLGKNMECCARTIVA